MRFFTLLFFIASCVAATPVKAQIKTDKFKQLYEELPTPNTYRTGSGAP
ncbi:MAG: hypothetical protein RL181_2914, partial [Bacteroidota bacterium]